jgi:bifunctional UDP-N-acetylglucosamine pyrophosphorylase/glucosamine-1-phosphate N-acetyltransferase
MQAVILAAGESSRFWPLSAQRHKCLFRVKGRPLIGYTLESLAEADVEEAIIVQSPGRGVERGIDTERYDLAVSFVVQEEPKGMGHALDQARPLLEEDFFVLTPYRANAEEFIEEMVAKKRDTMADAVLLSKQTEKPWKYGILEMEDDRAVSLVEKPDEGEAPSRSRVVGMYLLSEEFFTCLDSVDVEEYQYEKALDVYMEGADVRVVSTTEDASSIKYPWDLFAVVRELYEDMERDISPEAEIAESAVIDGDVVIEANVKVYEHAVIRGPCYLGEGAVVGNNALVRNHTDVDEMCVIGANSEVRGSLLQAETHVHKSFVGDCILGRNCRVGAGTVFANRTARDGGERQTVDVKLGRKGETMDTGLYRLGAMVGDAADIGTQANIMPGVQIGAESFVGPSTTLFDNVSSGERVYTEFENTRRGS